MIWDGMIWMPVLKNSFSSRCSVDSILIAFEWVRPCQMLLLQEGAKRNDEGKSKKKSKYFFNGCKIC